MEESSEKRRDRLQAMRMAAAAASSQAEPLASPSPSPYSTQPVRLSNPLAHPGGPSPSDRSPPVPRFDFYTDPMAAFSGERRRTGTRPTGGGVGGGGGSHYASPDNFSSPVRGPSAMPHPSHMSNAGPRNYHMPCSSATPPRQFQLNHAPDQTPWRSPIQFPSTFSGHGRAATPNPGAWNRSGGSSGYGGSFPHNYSARAAFGSTSPMSNPGNRGGSPHSRGRGRYQGRGGGSPSPGRNGGRGRGFNRGQDARYEPEHFYGRHMVEDPWRDLTPIVGNILVPQNGFDYWLPESMSAKKAKVASAETSVAFKSRSSLADCLALALEEANDA